jgi:hypothetical protein
MYDWRDKPVVIDHKRNVDSEMIECDIDFDCIIETVNNGIEVKKRKSGIIEKWYQLGKSIIIVAIEDCDDYWLVRHVGRIRATRKKLKLMRGG